MFTLTEEAAEMIRKMAGGAPREDLALTLCSSGAGCGGPALKVDMREPRGDDIEETVDGITFRIRASILRYLEGAVIEGADTFWGKRLKVSTAYGCR